MASSPFIAPPAFIPPSLVIAGAGQSNMVGLSPNLQSYSHPSLKAWLFGNDEQWKELSDPWDDAANSVDSINIDNNAGGSFIPLLATLMLENLGLEVGFVPSAKSGTSILSWLPNPANHADRSSRYGSLIHRVNWTGARVVLWWQGENDAFDGMSQAEYNNHLDTIANALFADAGVKLMPFKLQNSAGIPPEQTAVINAAIEEAWNDNPNIIGGVDLSDIDTDDDYHLFSLEKLTETARRVFTALQAHV